MRRESGARVVAITGSAGKTTTKDTIAALLGARYRVVKNAGNLNNHLGLPLSLLELRHGADVAVMELGMNHAGEIRMLVGIAEPEVRVWTNVGDAHIGYFGSRGRHRRRQGRDPRRRRRPTTLLVANADDPLVMARVPAFAGRVVTFGTGGARRRARRRRRGSRPRRHRARSLITPAGRRDLQGAAARPRQPDERAVRAPRSRSRWASPLDDDRRARRRSCKPSARRGAVLRLPKGVTVIDDSYNSSPSALHAIARGAGALVGRAAASPCSARCSSSAICPMALHDECGRAAAAQPAGDV